MSVRAIVRDGVAVPLDGQRLIEGEVVEVVPVDDEEAGLTPLQRMRKFAREYGADLPDDWVFDRAEIYP